MSSLNREANARAYRSAAVWDKRKARRLRREEMGRVEPPLPKSPRVPAFAASWHWAGGAAGCDRGRGGVSKVDRTE